MVLGDCTKSGERVVGMSLNLDDSGEGGTRAMLVLYHNFFSSLLFFTEESLLMMAMWLGVVQMEWWSEEWRRRRRYDMAWHGRSGGVFWNYW